MRLNKQMSVAFCLYNLSYRKSISTIHRLEPIPLQFVIKINTLIAYIMMFNHDNVDHVGLIIV
jgi:hypothetical protein